MMQDKLKPHLGAKWINENIDTLPKGMWVASVGFGILYKAKTIYDIEKLMLKDGVSKKIVAVHYTPLD